jgi:glycerophosphoryl diester phosphodiesterase
MMDRKPLIIAHRGASANAPENTLAAFAEGLKQGAQGVELDVHLTADGRLCVIHDHELGRTTPGNGLIQEKRMDELKNEDAGNWFAQAFTGECIPELEEVLSIFPEGYFINIEIKNGPAKYQLIGRKVAEALRPWKEKHRYIISSFDHQVLQEVHEADQELSLGLLFEARLYNVAAYVESLPYPVQSLHVWHHLVDQELVEEAHRSGLLVLTYTVDREQDLARVVAAGVDGVICNGPGRVLSILGQAGSSRECDIST